MKKKTVFQSINPENKDCGLACLEMLTHLPLEIFRQRLKIKTTRNTKKRELLGELQANGFKIIECGRISAKKPLSSLLEDALVFGRIDPDGEKIGHWTIWDASIAVLRDPNGYRATYKPTWYATVSKK